MNNYEIFLNEAILFRKSGDYLKYKDEMQILLAQYKDNPIINYNYAWSLDLLGLESEAIIYYIKAIDYGLDGVDLCDALLGLGSSYRLVGNLKKSKEILEKAISLFPNDNAIKIFYAITLNDLNESKPALKILLNCLTKTSADKRVLEYKKSIDFYSNNL